MFAITSEIMLTTGVMRIVLSSMSVCLVCNIGSQHNFRLLLLLMYRKRYRPTSKRQCFCQNSYLFSVTEYNWKDHICLKSVRLWQMI